MPIAQHHLWSADCQFTHFTCGHCVRTSFPVHDACICIRERQSDRSGNGLLVVGREFSGEQLVRQMPYKLKGIAS